MTNNAHFLTNATKYFGDLKIHTTDGNHLAITVVGDISSSLTNVFVSSDLKSNLIFVGQLVDNDCQVEFSKSSCLVQDQQLGKMIVKGLKLDTFFQSISLWLHVFPYLMFLVILFMLIPTCGISILDIQIQM